MSMDRRALLLSFIAGAAALDSEASLAESAVDQSAAIDPSLYIPKAHLVEDRKFLHDFMDEFPFVDVVTTSPTLRITHIPSFIDRTLGAYGTVFGHISAQNPQRQAFDGAHTAVIVFRGPQGYISPSWYAKSDVVPTWNFSVVHAIGKPRAIVGNDATHALLARLIAKFERAIGGSAYDFSKLADSYVTPLMAGIAPFSMEIELLEGKFKLGQERSEGDKKGVLEHLPKNLYHERSLADLTQSVYRRDAK